MHRRNLRPYKILTFALIAAPACTAHPAGKAQAHADVSRAAAAATSIARASEAVRPVTDDEGYPLVGNVTGKVPDYLVER